MSRSYFVFECYRLGSLIFRSIGRNSDTLHPEPVGDPILRDLQRRLKANSDELSYQFVASGLTRSAAMRLLIRCNQTEPVPSGVFWHPQCGLRMSRTLASQPESSVQKLLHSTAECPPSTTSLTENATATPVGQQ